MTQQEQVVKDLRSLRALRDETESLWDLAVDTAEEGRRDGAAEDRDAAMGCWADAIQRDSPEGCPRSAGGSGWRGDPGA